MLTQINPNIISTINPEEDIITTFFNLRLIDFDWLNYSLETNFKTSKMGNLEVIFKYDGIINSEMLVKQTNDKGTYEYKYSFDSDIFIKNITKFLEEHINILNKSNNSFYSEDFIVNFFNEVIENGSLEERKAI